MTSERFTKAGVEYLLEELHMRFEIDATGRICGTSIDGVLPRFVLGRAAEGCVWRFSAGLPDSLVRSVAKLAGRERGSVIDGESTAPPERLVMMVRLLRNGDALPNARRELITRDGALIGELWTVA